MLAFIKQRIKSILPYQYHFYFAHKTRNYVQDGVRQDRISFPVQDNVYLEVYWKIYGIGRGPALILNACGEEVLRFDCYGEKVGHFHATVTEFQPNARSLMYFREATVEDQIDRALFELDRNLGWYLDRHPLKKIRMLKIKKDSLREACTQARQKMLEYHGKVMNYKL